MESQPLGYLGRPGVPRHAAGSFSLHDDDDDDGDPFLIVREGNGGAGTGASYTRPSHALRMNLDVHSSAWFA